MSHTHNKDIVGVLAALRAGAYEYAVRNAQRAAPRRPVPFVTISRQAGAGGRAFARRLVDRLNAVDPGPLPWTVWDNELVEKVAAEQQPPVSAAESPQQGERPSWFEHFLAALALGDPREHPDEFQAYGRSALTIRALAEMGRVVVVGRGGAFITHGLPGGVHLRLVAPLEDRIALTAERLCLTHEAAAAAVRERDQSRESFYRRFWPKRPPVPESFTATFNTAAVSGDQLVDCVLPLVLPGVTRPPTAARHQAVAHDCCSRQTDSTRKCAAADRRAEEGTEGALRVGTLS